MKNWKTRLSLVLVCQLLLAIGLWAASLQQKSGNSVASKLVSFQASDITKIVVKEKEKEVKLKKTNDTWELPDYHSLGANPEKVKTLLADLANLKGAEKVGLSKSAHSRFEVSEETANTRVQLFKGDDAAVDLLVGKSPALGKRYIRVQDQVEVYLVKWDVFGLQSNASAWFDKTMWSAGKLQNLKFPKFEISLVDGKWKSGDQELQATKVQPLVAAFENLRLMEVEDQQVEVGFQVSVTKADQTEFDYSIKMADNKYYISRNDSDLTFQIPKQVGELLYKAKLSDLTG